MKTNLWKHENFKSFLLIIFVLLITDVRILRLPVYFFIRYVGEYDSTIPYVFISTMLATSISFVSSNLCAILLSFYLAIVWKNRRSPYFRIFFLLVIVYLFSKNVWLFM